MTVLYSFELSLLVELLQLVFKVGSFDVDDLFLNTIGGLLGYLVYKGLLYLWKRYEKARENPSDTLPPATTAKHAH